MPTAAHDNSAVKADSEFSVAEIFAIRGLNTNDNAISLNTDEMTAFTNFMIGPRFIRRRLGAVSTGTPPTGLTSIKGLGHMEQDSGTTLLFLGSNGVLYKLGSGTWTASDKTNYDVTNDAVMATFTSKSGNSVETGTSTAGTTKYLIEDASKNWTPGAYQGKCVVIAGEVKYIADNTKTTLFLSDRLNSDTDSDYQTKAYAIHAIAPMLFVSNGVDSVQKYNLTAHVAIDGTHVTGGEAMQKFRHMAVHQGRLWGAKGSGNDNDRVSISDVAVGEQFTKDTNLNINLQFMNDGDDVTGLASLPLTNGSVLLVTKNESVHTVEGDNVLNYATHARYAKDGCIAPKTLKVSGRSALMLGYNGIIRFSGDGGTELLEKPIPVSEAIDPDIAALSLATRRAACAEIWNNRYYLCIGGTMYAYDILESIRRQQHIWSVLEWPWDIDWVHAAGNVLYGGRNSNGQIYQLFSGNDDDGQRITATMETSWVTFPGAPVTCVDRVEFPADKSSGVILRLAYAVDGGTYSSYIVATLDEDLGVYRFPIKDRGTSFKFKLIDNATTTPVRIAMPIRIFYSVDTFGERDTAANLTHL